MLRQGSLKAFSTLFSWCRVHRLHIFTFMWNYALNCQNKFDLYDITSKMTNIKGDLWFLPHFPFRQRMRPITQIKNIPAVSQRGRHPKLHQEEEEEVEEEAEEEEESISLQRFRVLTRDRESGQISNSIQKSIFLPSADYEEGHCSTGWDLLCNTPRQANSSISCFPHTTLKPPMRLKSQLQTNRTTT